MFRSHHRRTAQRQEQSYTPRYHLMTDEQLIAIGALYHRMSREYCLVFWLTNPNDPQHCCPDCASMADRSPYSAPGSQFHPLNQTPGDGQTRCGADCTCQLSYMDMAIGTPKETYQAARLPWPDHDALYYRLTWRQRRYVSQYGYELKLDTKPEAVPEWQDDDA